MRRKKLDRIVLDTNVWVGYVLYGKLSRIAELVTEYDITIFSCDELLDELSDVLSRPAFRKYLTLPSSQYVSFVKDVTKNITIDRRFDRAADPDDNFLFDLAYSAKCYYVVTEETALLNMKHVFPIRIISFKELKKLLRQ